MSVRGILKSYASRLTRTTSPSTRVGRIEPEGMGFQSAMADRKNPKQSKKIRKPRFFLIQRFMGTFRGDVRSNVRHELHEAALAASARCAKVRPRHWEDDSTTHA